MVLDPETSGALDYARKLGLTTQDVVQEIGWDEDCDSSISEAFEDVIDAELLDPESNEISSLILLWWRKGDEDLVDSLVEVSRNLGDNGRICLLTPGAGKTGAAEPGLIAEAAKLAGFVQTKAARINAWQVCCLVQSWNKKA